MIYVLLYGRLGNNLSQVAAAASLAQRVGQAFAAVPSDYHCPEPDNCSMAEYLRPYRTTIFRHVPFVETVPQGVPVVEEGKVDWEHFTMSKDQSVLLNGFWQHPRYYDQALVQSLFGMDEGTLDYLRAHYNFLFEGGEEWTAVVVRRGDYLHLKAQYAVCADSFYRRAMRKMEHLTRQKQHFLFISDDIKWCEARFGGGHDSVRFVQDEPPLIDLYLASLCQHHILSNSSFAWWGAYLGSAEGFNLTPAPWYGIASRRLEKGAQAFAVALPHSHRICSLSHYYWEGVALYLRGGIRKYCKL